MVPAMPSLRLLRMVTALTLASTTFPFSFTRKLGASGSVPIALYPSFL